MEINNEKAVIITGGSGFIGSNVARLFVESGFNVINIDRKKSCLLYTSPSPRDS